MGAKSYLIVFDIIGVLGIGKEKHHQKAEYRKCTTKKKLNLIIESLA